jgi:hypothetical protein
MLLRSWLCALTWFWEGGSGALYTDLLSSAELALWLCAQEQMNVRRLKTNKEEEEVGGRSPTLG